MGVAFAETGGLFDLARAADRSGWHGITVSDHVFFPRNLESTYPYTPDGRPGWQPDTAWPDPWVTIGALAAATERLRFTTNIYVGPARDLFTVAKAVSTAAVLSGERVSVGLAPGWCEEEFIQMGQDFATRGKRLNEMIPALRELWSGDWVSFAGEHYQFDELKMTPTPAGRIPIYVGGDSPAALRRAARLGDGWIGTLYEPAEAEAKVAELHGYLLETGREGDDFEIILSLFARDELDRFRRFEDLGVTGIIHAPWMLASADDPAALRQARLDAVERFAEDFIAPLS